MTTMNTILKHTLESGNVIVGHSGGPTAVINASLAGVYQAAIQRGAGKVYGIQYATPLIQAEVSRLMINGLPGHLRLPKGM